MSWSVIGSSSRSRNALSVTAFSFFIWWVAFFPSRASIVQPLMVCARITVGWPTCFAAASKAAYTLR